MAIAVTCIFFILGCLTCVWTPFGCQASTIRSDDTGYSGVVDVLCQSPDNRANSMVNIKEEWSPVGTVANYTCDPGFYLVGGPDYRVCQINGNWSGEAPSCLKKVSFGKSVECMGAACEDLQQRKDTILALLDNKKDSCILLLPKDNQQQVRFKIDLLEHFEGIRSFRFLFRGNVADSSIARITVESVPNRQEELKPSECTVEQRDLEYDYRETLIRPNHALQARYVNIFLKIPTHGVWFCEAEVYSDKAPSVHQCFGYDQLDETRNSIEILKGTTTYGRTCYSFDTRLESWSRARQLCKAVNGGQLASDITLDVNDLLTNFAKANIYMPLFWIGAYTDKRVDFGLSGHEYDWHWLSGHIINKDLFDPKHVNVDNCLAIHFPRGMWLNYTCNSIMSSICQTEIKRCSSPERRSGIRIGHVQDTTIGTVLLHDCPDGYILVGTERRECLATGSWSGEAPYCLSNGTIHHSGGLQMDNGVMAGIIIAAVAIGIMLVVIVVTIIIFKRKGSFKKTIHFKHGSHGESVETLDNDNRKQDIKSLNQRTSKNYDTIEQHTQEAHQ